MANNIFVLEDGTKELTIVNKYKQEICKIHIRPGDLSILDRYNELTEGFSDIVAPLSGIELNNDGTSDMEGWQKVKEIEQELIDRLNTVFDSNDIGNIFKNRNAFSSIDGKFYVEHVIEMLGKVALDEMEAENVKVQKRVDKYTKDLK